MLKLPVKPPHLLCCEARSFPFTQFLYLIALLLLEGTMQLCHTTSETRRAQWSGIMRGNARTPNSNSIVSLTAPHDADQDPLVNFLGIACVHES
ncbi:hypothetical protein GE09DRAFT_227243 [Coniochaeta sp. 2T2.1]|nr:hypothetical protein GE09DRAFT_227243 [Coniochaeta sp. 2T2.1]